MLVICYALLYRLNSVLKRIGAERILPRSAIGLDDVKRLIQREVWVQVQSGLSQGMWMRLRLPGEGAYWKGSHEPDVQNAIFEMARKPWGMVKNRGKSKGPFFPLWVNKNDDNAMVPIINGPRDLIVVVAGGAGGKSMWCPTAGAQSLSVSKLIERRG